MVKEINLSLAFSEIGPQTSFKSEQVETQIQTVQKTDRKSRVMIFSRDLDARFLYKTFLELHGFKAVEAENKNDLITAIQKRRPDLILMDVGRPFSENLSVLSDLRKNKTLENVPFILLSGMAQKVYRTAAVAAGAAEYLVKPVDFDLLECLLRLADSRNHQYLGGD